MLKLLPTCLLRHFLLNYLDFADLQRVIECTHYKLPESLIETADYLVNKRDFSEKEVKIILNYKKTGHVSLAYNSPWNVIQYLILHNQALDAFFDLFEDNDEAFDNTKYEEAFTIDRIVKNGCGFILTYDEETVIETLREKKFNCSNEIILLLIAKNYKDALNYFTKFPPCDTDNLVMYAAMLGKWEILKWAAEKKFKGRLGGYIQNIPKDNLMPFLNIMLRYDPAYVKQLF
jgi:hypothetical protein